MDVTKLVDEFEQKHLGLLDRLAGEGTQVGTSLMKMLKENPEAVIKGEPVNLVTSVLRSWFGSPHMGVGRKFERNKARNRIIRKLRTDVLPKDIAAKAFQKGVSANALTADEKSYLRESLVSMLKDLGMIIEGVVKEHSFSSTNEDRINAAKAEMQSLLKELEVADKKSRGGNKVLPDPKTVQLPEVSAESVYNLLKGEFSGAPDEEIKDVASKVKHNYDSVIGTLRAHQRTEDESDLSKDEIPHAAEHMAKRIMKVTGSEKYDTARSLHENTPSYTGAADKLIKEALKAKALFGEMGLELQAIGDFRTWFKHADFLRAGGGQQNRMSASNFEKALEPITSDALAGKYSGKPKELEDDLNSLGKKLGAKGSYMLPDHVWDSSIKDKIEDSSWNWVEVLKHHGFSGEFLTTINASEPLKDQWFMGEDADILAEKEVIQVIAAAADWVADHMKGDRSVRTDLQELLRDALHRGEYVNKIDTLYASLQDIGVPLTVMSHFSEKRGPQGEKHPLLSYLANVLERSMMALWEPEDDRGPGIGSINVRLRELANEVRRLRDEDEALLPSGHGSSLALPKGSLMPNAYKKRIAEVLKGGMDQKTVRTNPFTESRAEDYVTSILGNLSPKEGGTSPDERQPDYPEILTYGEGFWTGLRSFVDNFEPRFKEYKKRMEKVLSQTPHEVPDLESDISAGLSDYTKAVEAFTSELSSSARAGEEDKDRYGKAVLDLVKTKVADHLTSLDKDSVDAVRSLLDKSPVLQAAKASFADAAQAADTAVKSGPETPEAKKALAVADNQYESLMTAIKGHLERSANNYDTVRADLLARSAMQGLIREKKLAYKPLYQRLTEDTRRSGIDIATRKMVTDSAKKMESAVLATPPDSSDVKKAANLLSADPVAKELLSTLEKATKDLELGSTHLLEVRDHGKIFDATRNKISQAKKDEVAGALRALGSRAEKLKSEEGLDAYKPLSPEQKEYYVATGLSPEETERRNNILGEYNSIRNELGSGAATAGVRHKYDTESHDAAAEAESGISRTDRSLNIRPEPSKLSPEETLKANAATIRKFTADALDGLYGLSRSLSRSEGGWATPYVQAVTDMVTQLVSSAQGPLAEDLKGAIAEKAAAYDKLEPFEPFQVKEATEKVMESEPYLKFVRDLNEAMVKNDKAGIEGVLESIGTVSTNVAKATGVHPKVAELIISRNAGQHDPVKSASDAALAKMNKAKTALAGLMRKSMPVKSGSDIVRDTETKAYNVTTVLKDAMEPLKHATLNGIAVEGLEDIPALRKEVQESRTYQSLVKELISEYDSGSKNPDGTLLGLFNKAVPALAKELEKPVHSVAPVAASLLKKDLPAAPVGAPQNQGTAKRLFLTEEAGSVGTLEPHNYPGIEDGAFNAMKRYYADLKKTHYFKDIISGGSPLTGSFGTGEKVVPTAEPEKEVKKREKGKGGGFNRGVHQLSPGDRLHEIAIQDLEEANNKVINNPLYKMVMQLMKSKPGANASEFFTNVQEWNEKNPGEAITTGVIDSFMKAMESMLSVEKVYDEEASRVKSEFNKALRGVYRSLQGIEKRRAKR